MAWNLNEYSRKFRKEAEAHTRPDRFRADLNDQYENTRPHKRAVRTKRWGIELTYIPFFMHNAGPIVYRQWYETNQAREQALEHHQREKLMGRPRYTKVERCYR